MNSLAHSLISISEQHACNEMSSDIDLAWISSIVLSPKEERAHLKYNLWHCLAGRLYIAKPRQPISEYRYIFIRYNNHQFFSVDLGIPVSPIVSPVIRARCRRLWPYRHRIDINSELVALRYESCLIVRDKIALISWSDEIHNYYHLMLDICARIEAIVVDNQRFSGRVLVLGEIPKLAETVIHYLYPSIASRLLSLVHTKAVIKNCIIPHSAEPSYLDMELVKRLSLRICEFLYSDQRSLSGLIGHDRIYIKRGNARNGRSISNEIELSEALETLGFAIFTMDELEVGDQWAIFHHAKIIVSPHGAALTNLLACQQGATVVELLQSDFHPNTYRYIAKVLSIDYISYIYGSANKPGCIDIAEIMGLLSGFCGG